MDYGGLWEFKKYFWRLGFLQVIRVNSLPLKINFMRNKSQE